MKYTLLDLVQTVLSRMDSDEVNSINDNQEAQQVALIVRTCYFDILSRTNLPEHYDTFQLTASGDSSKPTVMYLPDTIDRMIWIKYNKIESGETDPNYSKLEFLPFDQFISRSYRLSLSDSTVESMDLTDSGGDTFSVHFYNDIGPTYYTTFDDNTILFDSYDSAVDTTLQKSKTLAYGVRSIPFNLTDNFTPDLDDTQFALLLNEATSMAFGEMKQTQNPYSEVKARRGWVSLQKSKTRVEGLSDFDKLPYFGRK